MKMKRNIITTLLAGLFAICSWADSDFGPRYWTADGQEHPLTMEGIAFTIPDEAVAVDLRMPAGEGEQARFCTLNITKANPNRLYYLNTWGYHPEELDGANIVDNGEAGDICLIDGYDFFCPIPFTAASVSYLLSLSDENSHEGADGNTVYSETLMLPFAASHALNYDTNVELTLADFQVSTYTGECYGSQLQFQSTASWPLTPNSPYLLDNLPTGRVMFYSEQVKVPTSQSTETLYAPYRFKGTTTRQTLSTDDFVWHPANGCFVRCEQETQIAPFRAYISNTSEMITAAEELTVSVEDDQIIIEPTSVSADAVWHSTAESPTNVYAVDGRLVSTGPKRSATNGLRKGIYIIGRRKIVVK